MKRVLALGVAVVLVTGVGVGGWFAYAAFNGGGQQPAAVIPETAVGLLSLDLDPSVSQKINLAETVGKDIARSGGKSNPEQVFESLLDLKGCGMTYASDIKPWVGKRFAVAAVPVKKSLLPVVAIQTSDEGAATLAFGKLAKCPRFKDSAYQAKKGYLLAAPALPGYKEAFSVLNGSGPSLEQNKKFKAAFAGMEDRGIAHLWVRPKAVADVFIPAFLPPTVNDVSQQPTAPVEPASPVASLAAQDATPVSFTTDESTDASDDSDEEEPDGDDPTPLPEEAPVPAPSPTPWPPTSPNDESDDTPSSDDDKVVLPPDVVTPKPTETPSVPTPNTSSETKVGHDIDQIIAVLRATSDGVLELRAKTIFTGAAVGAATSSVSAALAHAPASADAVAAFGMDPANPDIASVQQTAPMLFMGGPFSADAATTQLTNLVVSPALGTGTNLLTMTKDGRAPRSTLFTPQPTKTIKAEVKKIAKANDADPLRVEKVDGGTVVSTHAGASKYLSTGARLVESAQFKRLVGDVKDSTVVGFVNIKKVAGSASLTAAGLNVHARNGLSQETTVRIALATR